MEQKHRQTAFVDGYYSREARALRRVEAEARREATVAAARALYDAGDHDGARIKLFDLGVECAEYYLSNWA